MPNRLRVAAQHLADRQAEWGSETVNYIHFDGTRVNNIPAVLADRFEPEETVEGLTQSIKKQSFMLRMSDIPGMRPGQGARIEYTNAQGQEEIHEVTSNGATNSDRFGIRWRVETNLISIL